MKTISTLGHSLKNLICTNKSKLLSNGFPYQLDSQNINRAFSTETGKNQTERRIANMAWTVNCINSETLPIEQQYDRRKIRVIRNFKNEEKKKSFELR